MCRVLIIDDEDAICRLLIYALVRNDIEADIATDGTEGLGKFDREIFDVVITDMLMPGIDGNAVAAHIRNSDRAETPIIGLSGTSWLMDRGQFDVVFEKPFPIRRLVDTVKDLARGATQPVAAVRS